MAATSSVFLNVRNLEKSLEFYEALGFEVENKMRDDDGRLSYVDLALDGADLSLGQILTDADDEYARWVSNPELGAGVILYFTVPDVDAVHARARTARATIEVPLRDRSYGRAFNLNDPDGYVVCFMTEKVAKAKAGGAKATRKTASKRKR
ncbi:MAG TPA: VOC family protein [Candidatus Thermoplasmatota archaeon]|jgi:catechol 2,3-dioxygenase-like lactoylglutathione lyase family enzyme|nr:VOC family protein [Candidatus Thermoplasmatota archaeon]